MRVVLRAAIVPLVMSLLLAGACFFAVGLHEPAVRGVLNGRGLGLFLAGFAVVAVLLPGLGLAEGRRSVACAFAGENQTAKAQATLRSLLAAGGVIDGVGLVWLIAVFRTDTSLLQWFLLYLLLTAFGVALWGLTAVLVRIRLNEVLAAGVTTLIGLAWLAWPVWLSPWLSGESGAALAQRLVGVHPLFAANGVVRQFGAWPEHAVLYRLTTLGQDLSYQLPAGIAAAFLLHALLAGAFALLGWAGRRRGVL